MICTALGTLSLTRGTSLIRNSALLGPSSTASRTRDVEIHVENERDVEKHGARHPVPYLPKRLSYLQKLSCVWGFWFLVPCSMFQGLGFEFWDSGPGPDGGARVFAVDFVPANLGFRVQGLQGYLAHKKTPPPRTLQ